MWQKEIQSVYFMGQLGYKNYLFLDVTGRNDWSSALGKYNYSFFYPSVSVSWVFSETFGLTSDLFTFGKVRASWAQAGNDSDPYLTKHGYSSYTTSFLGQGFASKSSTIPLFDLKNELTNSWEFGADVWFFKNRIGLDLTYYNARTTNQILPVQISKTSGYSQAIINAGEIQNKGVEIILNAGIIRSGSGFRWDLTFNYAKNNSRVVELAPGIDSYLLASHYPNNIEVRPGEAYGNIVGYAFKRSPEGRRIVSPGGYYVRETRQSVLGNITPDWIGGLNNTFSFKGFSFNFLIDFVQGGELSSSTKYQMCAKGTGLFTEEGRRPRDTDDQGNQLPYVGVLDGVVEVFNENGDVIGYEENTQAVDGQTYWAIRAWRDIGEEFILDASYIMLRELIFSYDFKLKISSVAGIKISLVGRNLWYIEEHMQGLGISPESAPNTSAGAQGLESLSMPATRSYGLNIKFTF
jgi:outer membrane receptor protein involved in Fe transport